MSIKLNILPPSVAGIFTPQPDDAIPSMPTSEPTEVEQEATPTAGALRSDDIGYFARPDEPRLSDQR